MGLAHLDKIEMISRLHHPEPEDIPGVVRLDTDLVSRGDHSSMEEHHHMEQPQVRDHTAPAQTRSLTDQEETRDHTEQEQTRDLTEQEQTRDHTDREPTREEAKVYPTTRSSVGHRFYPF